MFPSCFCFAGCSLEEVEWFQRDIDTDHSFDRKSVDFLISLLIDVRLVPPFREAAEGETVEARRAFFLRFHGVLLRHHIASVIFVLKEDGWLEAWEKDQICSIAGNSKGSGAQNLLRSYMQFMETNEVHTFVTALKAGPKLRVA